MLVPVVFASITLLALYNLQVIKTDYYVEVAMKTVMSTETVQASRGSILDRYGRLLVSNRISYNIKIDRQKLVDGKRPNETILELIDCVKSSGKQYTDTLPVSFTSPYVYTDMTDLQKNRLRKYKAHFKLEEEISAAELMVYFREHYSVPEEFSDDKARLAIGVRYELETRELFNTSDYYFSEDINSGLIALVSEKSFPGVSIKTSSVREYHTTYAAHILGRTGLMNEEEYKYYSTLNYPMNAIVGKEGAERAFEDYLHGIDGKRVTVTTQDGDIVNTYYKDEPKAGNDVALTIDIYCQQAAEDSLKNKIEQINKERTSKFEADVKLGKTDKTEPILAEGGAVAVIKVDSGELLALASYPSFNPSTFSEDYSSLLLNSLAPLYNRATQGTYSPGSTFKLVTATAGLQEGIIQVGTKIYDKGIIDEYEGYSYKCWIYPGSHGDINVKEAIQVSCNYFFYVVGSKVGIDKLSAYASAYGLGQHTGIELYEETGVLASRSYKERVIGETWYVGDTLQASIGQSYNLFTPLQLASYAATLASNGNRYAAHLLKSIKSYDGSTTVYEYQPKVLSKVNAGKDYFDAIHEGMLMASLYGSASYVFGNYDIKVASKTGTAQVKENDENNAVFIAFAPYDKPEIAVAVVVEKGSAGWRLAEVARDIFDYYFSNSKEKGPESENIIIP
jgi:penicillin-binding protein 2